MASEHHWQLIGIECNETVPAFFFILVYQVMHPRSKTVYISMGVGVIVIGVGVRKIVSQLNKHISKFGRFYRLFVFITSYFIVIPIYLKYKHNLKYD